MSVAITEKFVGLVTDGVEEFHYGEGGNVFLNKLPDRPDEAMAVFLYASSSDFPGELDEYRFQVRIRGADIDDSLSGLDLAHKVYGALHGISRKGVIRQILAAGPPITLGYDERDRPEWVVNFMVAVRNELTHRSFC